MNVLRFRSLVRAVLLSSGPCLAVACSSNDVTEMPERAQCVDVRAANRYTALTLAAGVDGIAFATRGAEKPASSPPAAAETSTRIDTLGTPCASASDREACARRIDGLLADPASTGWSIFKATCGGCPQERMLDLGVVTRGDDVSLATLDGVVRATAPIETRDEAATVLALKGYPLDCDMNNVRPEADGWTFKKTNSSCSGAVNEVFFKVLAATGEVLQAGSHQVREADSNCIEGRRPANLAPTGVSWLSSLAACFSEIAHMEAAAVLAFDDLEQQLRDLGAPPSLLERAARAREDEVTHAQLTAALAHRFGGAPQAPRRETIDVVDRSSPWLRLALENAVEGCVREAYGALVAAFQAAHASDAGVRAAFARIAEDEAEHAELSFAIDAWLDSQLTSTERRYVDEAKAQAWRDLAASCTIEPAPEVVAIAGVPSAADAKALLEHLTWAVADRAA